MSRVLKANAVTVDKDNKYQIEVSSSGAPAPVHNETEPETADEETPEEKAQKIIKKAERDAESIRKKATSEAAAILEDAKKQAQAEADAIREQAQADGYRIGTEKADAEGKAIKAKANAVLAEANRERAEAEASLEPDMVALIQQIVTKLLGDTVKINPNVIVSLIRQGISGSTLAGNVYIHVSPYDFEQVMDNKEALLAMADSSVKLEIVRDPSLNAMDCVIETPMGNIDCSLNQQFDTLRDNLNYILQNK